MRESFGGLGGALGNMGGAVTGGGMPRQPMGGGGGFGNKMAEIQQRMQQPQQAPSFRPMGGGAFQRQGGMGPMVQALRGGGMGGFGGGLESLNSLNIGGGFGGPQQRPQVFPGLGGMFGGGRRFAGQGNDMRGGPISKFGASPDPMGGQSGFFGKVVPQGFNMGAPKQSAMMGGGQPGGGMFGKVVKKPISMGGGGLGGLGQRLGGFGGMVR